MTADLEPLAVPVVDEPGIYALPFDWYQADTAVAPQLGRTLSHTGAKKVLESPARFAYWRDHPVEEIPDYFDFGHAAHRYILEAGDEVARVDADDWRKTAAREQRDLARVNGRIPLLAKDDDKAQLIADTVRAHRVAGRLFEEGQPEQSVYWVDQATGVTCRCRPDWLRTNAILDVKTTAVSADLESFARTAARFSYHQQHAWYVDGVAAVTGEVLPFLFVVIEKAPPHLMAIYQLDADAVAVGRDLNRAALERYAECESAGEWPGYPTDIQPLSLPRWATRRTFEEYL